MDRVEFYDRSDSLVVNDLVIHIVMPDLNRLGYVIDRLKPVTVGRHGKAYWLYSVPVLKVVH